MGWEISMALASSPTSYRRLELPVPRHSRRSQRELAARGSARDSPLPRRQVLLSVPAWMCTSAQLASAATRPTLGEAARAIEPGGEALPEQEERVVKLFEQGVNAVTSVVDNSASQQQEGNGSGVCWDAKSRIVVTNWHVVKGALEQGLAKQDKPVAQIITPESAGPAYLLGGDKRRDIAVLQGTNGFAKLRSLELADSSEARVGQAAYVIGSPFGFFDSLSAGVISATGRDLVSGQGFISNGLQVDAAINPGNSGGAVLDSTGRLLGVASAIFTSTGTSQGVGFAIPSNTVQSVVEQIIQTGSSVRPELGISMATYNVARSLSAPPGALVQSISEGSAAEKAGLQGTRRSLQGIVRGDVIVAVDERAVNGPADLTAAIDQHAPGDSITLVVDRAGVGEFRVDVQLQSSES